MLARAQRIRETIGTAGWQDILAIHQEKLTESREDFFNLMSSKPETMNLKAAARYAVRAKALEDFRESIEDTQKMLAENNPQLARAGTR